MPTVCTTLSELLGLLQSCLLQMSYSHDEETQLMHMKHVTADEMWLKKNPGAQGLLTGSFHPMTRYSFVFCPQSSTIEKTLKKQTE